MTMLINGGADVNVNGGDGDTPLHRACDAGHESLVRMLGSMAAELSMSLTKMERLLCMQRVMQVMGP
jgi:ankyrin repeat protein